MSEIHAKGGSYKAPMLSSHVRNHSGPIGKGGQTDSFSGGNGESGQVPLPLHFRGGSGGKAQGRGTDHIAILHENASKKNATNRIRQSEDNARSLFRRLGVPYVSMS